MTLNDTESIRSLETGDERPLVINCADGQARFSPNGGETFCCCFFLLLFFSRPAVLSLSSSSPQPGRHANFPSNLHHSINCPSKTITSSIILDSTDLNATDRLIMPSQLFSGRTFSPLQSAIFFADEQMGPS